MAVTGRTAGVEVVHTDVVVHKSDLRQRQGVVEAHEDGRLHEDVNQVHNLVPEEKGSRP